jgi:hypothetical protein
MLHSGEVQLAPVARAIDFAHAAGSRGANRDRYLAGIRVTCSFALAACHANVARKMADSFSSSSLIRSG